MADDRVLDDRALDDRALDIPALGDSSAAPVPVLDDSWVADHLPQRPDRAHKGTFGKLLVLAGSLEYPGAALLAGLGAARMGAGLVCVAVPETLQRQLIGAVPELVWLPLAEEAPGVAGPGGWRRVAAEAGRYDAMVVGPGLGRHPTTLRRVRRLVADVRLPLVIDADGLNALAEADEWWRELQAPAVLTPHAAEFARLARTPGLVEDDDVARAKAAADASMRWGQVVVLKGAHSVVAAPDGRVVAGRAATPALATAGTGDVLAGVVGALLAAGLEPFAATACAVAVHGCAGLICEDRIGRAGVLATDVAGSIPEAIRRFSCSMSPGSGMTGVTPEDVLRQPPFHAG